MLQITVPGIEEGWDEVKQEFVSQKEQKLKLEHSLVSLSKWESKWCKPFLSSEKTTEEIIDYIKCMTVYPTVVDDDVYWRLSTENIEQINKYIGNPMTATTFTERKQSKRNSETITSELVYYWMVTFNIPFECQKWHLNRLLTLIRICNIKNQPQKKMSKGEILSQNAALNEARKKKLKTKG